jgi:hypothetical protein
MADVDGIEERLSQRLSLHPSLSLFQLTLVVPGEHVTRSRPHTERVRHLD